MVKLKMVAITADFTILCHVLLSYCYALYKADLCLLPVFLIGSADG